MSPKSTVEALVDGAGIAVGFVARHGAAVVELESARSLEPTRTLHLGDAPADAPPSLVRVGGRVLSGWIDLDGAHAGFVGERGVRLAESARALDLVAVRGEIWVAVAGESLVLHRLDRALRPTRAPELLLDRRDVDHLRLLENGGDALLLHTLADPVLVVHHLAGATREEVRHALTATPHTLCAASVPGTVALAIDDGLGNVSFATLDRRGRTKERLHRVRGARAAPSVCWLDDDFTLGTLDLDRGRFELARPDGRVVFAREGLERAPWVARHHDRRLLLFAARRDDDREQLVLHAIGREGDAQHHVIDVTPSDAKERARRAAARGALRQVVELAPTIGYRGATRTHRDGPHAVEVRFDTAPTRAALVEREDSLELVLSAGATTLPEIPEPSRGLRALFRRVAPWARELVDDEVGRDGLHGAHVSEVGRDGLHGADVSEVIDAGHVEGAAWIRVRIGETPPNARALVQWLRALAERAAG